MSARILEMRSGKSRSSRGRIESEVIDRQPLGYRTWLGLSGREYRHAVFSLIGCPPLSEANFVLVRRTDGDDAEVLHVDRVDDSTSSVNLAYVRRLGATLGANEVHIYDRAVSSADRARIELDIRSSLAIEDIGRRPLPALDH